jgi:hypothetical protein
MYLSGMGNAAWPASPQRLQNDLAEFLLQAPNGTTINNWDKAGGQLVKTNYNDATYIRATGQRAQLKITTTGDAAARSIAQAHPTIAALWRSEYGWPPIASSTPAPAPSGGSLPSSYYGPGSGNVRAPVSEDDNSILLIGAAALGAFFLLRSNKKKRRR